MNLHIAETCRDNIPGNVIWTDAPDPRLVIQERHKLQDILDVPVHDTAAVTCAVLFRHGEEWHAELAFEHFYVSSEWVRELLLVLQSANLSRCTPEVANKWCVYERHLQQKPDEVAFALSVHSATREEAHLICEPNTKLVEWRELLDEVLFNNSQYTFCHSLGVLRTMMGHPDHQERS